MRAPAHLRLVLCLATIAMVSACAGNFRGGSSTIPNQPPGLGSGAALASFIVQIPSASGTSVARRRGYASASTQSISVLASGGTPIALAAPPANPFVANLTPTSTGCVPAAGATPLTCTITAPVAATGSVSFTLTLYDGLNATGNALSTAAISPVLTLNANNTIRVTLNGIVASLQLTIADPNPPVGTAGVFPLTVNALDADGNTIIGPGAYVDAGGNVLGITLTNSDASGTTKLTKTYLTNPAQVASVSYNGKAVAVADVIAASATGIAPSSARFHPGSGATVEYSLSDVSTNAGDYITAGADGNVWLRKTPDNRIGENHVERDGERIFRPECE